MDRKAKGDEKEPRKYICTMDKPLGLEKHVFNIIWLGSAHVFGLYGLYMFLFGLIPRTTFIFCILHGYFAGFGITIGGHRFWAHKTFKAKLPLQILLAYMQTVAIQYPIFKWCRDHRIHHKYVETDADPHDARRGFWFSHIGWLLVKEHPAVQEKEATIDFSDLDNDPVVRFQTKYYWYLLILSFYIVPTCIQHLIWPQLSLYQHICINYSWYILSLNFTWLVNSAAHKWGTKPFDTKFFASDNRLVAILAIGEGWHNYHHTFPWDYKASELGLDRFNRSKMIIDFFAWMGWAYDLKTVPENIVRERANRTGDGSHGHNEDNANKNHSERGTEDVANFPPWGWGDKDIPEEHYQATQRLHIRG